MKKILVAADMTTHPCVGGNNQCVMQYVEILRRLGFDVYYLLIGIQGLSTAAIQATKNYWGNHMFFYRTPWWQTLFQRIYKRLTRQAYPDNVDFYYPAGLTRYVNRMQDNLHFTGLIVNYIWTSRLAGCNIPIKAIYTHDVFAYRDERMAAGANWHHHSAAQEARAVRRFNYILAIQDVERDYFKYLSPKSNVISVYSSFSFVAQPIKCNKNILFFSGGGDLNLTAIRGFITDIFPQILEYDNGIRLLIGGNICSYLPDIDAHDNIELLGRYDNPDDFYLLGDIVINPVYEGSGLKIKTFEAVSHGKVTIVHPHSQIGIYHPDIAPLIIVRTADDYISAIKYYMTNLERLAANKEKCQSYICQLNTYIETQYEDIFKI